MNKKTKKNTFEVLARRCFILALGIYIIGGLAMRSIESSLNVEQQDVENEIQTLKNDIDGLDIEKQEMTSFAHLNDVASQQGYTYSYSDVTAFVSGQ